MRDSDEICSGIDAKRPVASMTTTPDDVSIAIGTQTPVDDFEKTVYDTKGTRLGDGMAFFRENDHKHSLL